MRVGYSKALVWLRRTALALAGFVSVTIAGGFILQLCVGSDWYEHPWATVARVISFVHWFLGNTYVHWLGGAVIGFALGIWADDRLRWLAANSPPRAVPQREKGFLDYQLDLHNASKDVGEILVDISKRTAWISHNIEKNTSEIQKIAAQFSDGDTNALARKAFDVARKIARKFDKYCAHVSATGNKFTASITTMVTAVEWMFTNQPGWKNEKTLSQISNLRLAVGAAQKNIGDFIDGLRGMRGVSAELTAAIDHAVFLLMEFRTNMGRVETLCRSIIEPPQLRPPRTTQESMDATMKALSDLVHQGTE